MQAEANWLADIGASGSPVQLMVPPVLMTFTIMGASPSFSVRWAFPPPLTRDGAGGTGGRRRGEKRENSSWARVPSTPCKTVFYTDRDI